MQEGIHPKYEETAVSCACGEKFNTRSTKKALKLEICSKCHPFYTGTQKFIDTAGRVERFHKKFGKKKPADKKEAPAPQAKEATQPAATAPATPEKPVAQTPPPPEPPKTEASKPEDKPPT
ncbi:MAG: 50S ribosomal protein L31 [Planctomycetes bacterium]|nr:50S ribosomal protein L31 [Planctomycetota bacterium]